MNRMYKMMLFIFIAWSFSACGEGGGNADSKAFCGCYEKLSAQVEDTLCNESMERLEVAFLKDEERYESFRLCAMRECPEAKDIILGMSPLKGSKLPQR